MLGNPEITMLLIIGSHCLLKTIALKLLESRLQSPCRLFKKNISELNFKKLWGKCWVPNCFGFPSLIYIIPWILMLVHDIFGCLPCLFTFAHCIFVRFFAPLVTRLYKRRMLWEGLKNSLEANAWWMGRNKVAQLSTPHFKFHISIAH